MTKKLFIGLGIIIGLLVITNPTQTDFDRYLEGNGVNFSLRFGVQRGRISYFGVFSIYQYNVGGSGYGHKYIGIFKNFIQLD